MENRHGLVMDAQVTPPTDHRPSMDVPPVTRATGPARRSASGSRNASAGSRPLAGCAKAGSWGVRSWTSTLCWGRPPTTWFACAIWGWRHVEGRNPRGWCARKQENRDKLVSFWSEGRCCHAPSAAYRRKNRIRWVIFNGLLRNNDSVVPPPCKDFTISCGNSVTTVATS